jgi:hypothetical protein
MLTIDGVPKASYHAFRFLNRMRGKRYEISLGEPCPSPTRGAIITDEISSTRALIWNCVFPYDQVAPLQQELELPVPDALSTREHIRVTKALVKEGAGSAYEAWVDMGAPANLTRFEQEMLAACAEPAYESGMVPVKDGTVCCQICLNPNEFVFIEIGGDEKGKSYEPDEKQLALDQALMT